MNDPAPADREPDPNVAGDAEPLVRRLGVIGIWLIAINGTIGSGIFGTPGAVAAAVGIFSPFVFVLCGLLMAPIVLSFAEVASAYRGTGGPVLYIRAAFGPFASFQAGWTFYVARVSATAANIGLLVTTLSWFWPAAAAGGVRAALLVTVAGLLTWVNVVGTQHAMRSIGALTVLKFGPLLALALYGLLQLDGTAFAYGSTPLPGFGAVGPAVMLAIYAFVGWESALVPAGESKDPARDMPRALLWTLGTATVLYVVVQAVSIAVVPDLANTSTRPLVAVGEALFGPFGAALLTFCIVVSVGGNAASAALSTPRITYAMARAGNLPAVLGAVHARWHTPWISVLVYGALVLGLALYGTFVELAMISVLARLLIYLGVTLTVPHVRGRAAAPGQLRLPGGLLLPLLAAAVCVGLIWQVDAATFGWTAVCLLVGSVLFALTRLGARRRHA